VFDSMSEGVRVIDRSRRVVQSNAAGASFHGLITSADSVGEILGQLEALTPSGEVLPPTAWPGVRALAGDFVRDFELTMRRRDNGRFVVLEVNTALLSGEADKSGDIVITTHDITARKIAEQARGVSQRRLAGVIENLSEGLLIHGLDHDLVHMNRAALALYELPPTAKTTTSLRTFSEKFELATLDGAALAREDWPIARLLRGQPVNAIELRVRRRDRPGWERLFSYGGAVLHEPGAEPIVFVTVTDVTARRTAEKQLQKFNVELEQRVVDRTDQLQAKTRELEGFCYAISHDLKAPLRGIDGYSRLLSVEYGDQLDADGKKFIGNVRKAAAQMNRLIEDLLAYSKQERRTMVPSRIRLREFVVAKLQRHAADLTGVKLSVDVEDLRVRADREGLDMALRNLIDNAVKFSAHSQPPEIAIRSQVIGDRCVLSVSDNGTGFDMRYHDKIFEIFQRLHLAEDYPGTGVGLALVHKAMERMGGRVWAEGEPGVGATFHLELEITDEADGPETAY
jgi:signal transduction histidine kinase